MRESTESLSPKHNSVSSEPSWLWRFFEAHLNLEDEFWEGSGVQVLEGPRGLLGGDGGQNTDPREKAGDCHGVCKCSWPVSWMGGWMVAKLSAGRAAGRSADTAGSSAQRVVGLGLWVQWLLRSWWLLEPLAEPPHESHDVMLELCPLLFCSA